MKRVAGILLVLAAAVGFVVLAGGAGSDEPQGNAFKVELDNAFGLIEGGDFKVAGVRAGQITKLDLDRRTKHAVVHFTVTEKGFGDLRKDASCEVLPQSLVGEYYVDCQPGRSRAKLPAGGTIPVEQTAGTIPPDLVNNLLRRPTRERLSLVVAELGAAVAGNADNLNAALRRATPALRETNKVLALLADQNQVLADLTTNADRVVGDLAANRKDVARWVTEARDTASASAERDREIAAGFRRLPGFLRELRPTMTDLGRTVDAQGPALRTLSQSAGQLERLFENIPPFARATRPGIDALGEASKVGREAAAKARPTVAELARYAAGVPELGKNLAIILEHLDDRKYSAELDPRSPGGQGYTGLEALLQYVLDQTLSTTIHDGNTHILAAFPFEGECAAYADLDKAKELDKHCSNALGPNRIGFNVRDVTAPAGWDGKDRGGPEERVSELPVPIPLPRRRADRREEAQPEARREEQRDDSPRAPEVPKPKVPEVPRPRLPDVPRPELPKVPSPALPAPKAPDVPRVDAPRVDAPTRENQEAQQGLLDFLLGS
jgi:virulence factor Mce-like protein